MLDTRGMLPTTGTMSDEIRETPEDSAFEIIGRFLNIDCKHTEVEAPTDKESNNNKAYSGKAHRTTCNSLFLCDKDGILVGMGDPQPGRPADITNLREALPDLGRVTDSLADPDTPPGRRITVNVDRGMTGIQRARKGANVRIPHEAARAGPHARAAPRKLRNELSQGRHRDDLPPDQLVQVDRRRVQGDDQRPRNDAERTDRNRQPVVDHGDDRPLKGPPEGARAGPPAEVRIPRPKAPQDLRMTLGGRPAAEAGHTALIPTHSPRAIPRIRPRLPRSRPILGTFNARTCRAPPFPTAPLVL